MTPQAKHGRNGVSFGGPEQTGTTSSRSTVPTPATVFGLTASGTNGGQANVNPISIETIQEMQVVLSPYDVTQGGFTGGGINAVTKSGTNKFHGSAYGQFQNENFVGKSQKYNDVVTRNAYPAFKNKTYGASLGGAIIRTTVFYGQRRTL